MRNLILIFQEINNRITKINQKCFERVNENLITYRKTNNAYTNNV